MAEITDWERNNCNYLSLKYGLLTENTAVKSFVFNVQGYTRYNLYMPVVSYALKGVHATYSGRGVHVVFKVEDCDN